MTDFFCRRYDYHFRLERVAETFKRAESGMEHRVESIKTMRCRDCGTEITTTNISEVRIETETAPPEDLNARQVE